jgi:beta-fructofuranosidase
MNDPNGLIQWGGRYHMFYQYNPDAPVHGNIHWGHASSADLVYWQHEPIALAPEPGGPDAEGCWSGCAVNDGGVPKLIYSGHRLGVERPCLAVGSADLRTWNKHPHNPIIAAPPADLDVLAFRDHCIWREGDAWYMLIGTGVRDVGGAALLYRSPNLIDWDYRGPLLVGDAQATEPVWTGTIWECPELFRVDERHVLLVSAWHIEPHSTVAFVGRYADERFSPERVQPFDHGAPYYYAPQSFTDERGRRIAFGWLQEGRSIPAREAAGWAGVMSLPRELGLTAAGDVTQRPVAELTRLRRQHMPWRGLGVRAGSPLPLPQISGDTLELQLELQPGTDGECGVAVRCSPDGAEQTRITYQAAQRRLVIDRSRSSLDPDPDRTPHSAPLTLGIGEPLRLRIFLDRSVLEVFANDRVAVTTRIYPARPDSLGVALIAVQRDAWLAAIDVWTMAGIW